MALYTSVWVKLLMKEFKVALYRAPGFYGIFFIAGIQIFLIFTALRDIKEYWSLIFIALIIFGVVEFILYHSIKIKVIVDQEGLKVVLIDKTETAKWSEIRKIERLIAVGTIRYVIRKDKGHIEFPDYIENSDEIISEIEQRTGIKPSWGI